MTKEETLKKLREMRETLEAIEDDCPAMAQDLEEHFDDAFNGITKLWRKIHLFDES